MSLSFFYSSFKYRWCLFFSLFSLCRSYLECKTLFSAINFLVYTAKRLSLSLVLLLVLNIIQCILSRSLVFWFLLLAWVSNNFHVLPMNSFLIQEKEFCLTEAALNFFYFREGKREERNVALQIAIPSLSFR